MAEEDSIYYVEFEEWCLRWTKDEDLIIYGHDVEEKLPELTQPGSEASMKEYGKLHCVHRNRISASTLAVVSSSNIEAITLYIFYRNILYFVSRILGCL